MATEYRNAFEKIYPEIIAGRYSNGGNEMMKWIQEHNPNFDTALYADLMQSIEVQREAFATAQTRMLDIINMREALIEQYPSRWFISNKDKIEYTVISSTHTQSVMLSGTDDDILSFK